MLDLVGGADPNIGYMTIGDSQFKLAHNNTTISGELDLGFNTVSCNNLNVLNKTVSYDLEVNNQLDVLINAAINELDANNAIIKYLQVINNAIIPKINSW